MDVEFRGEPEFADRPRRDDERGVTHAQRRPGDTTIVVFRDAGHGCGLAAAQEHDAVVDAAWERALAAGARRCGNRSAPSGATPPLPGCATLRAFRTYRSGEPHTGR